MVTASFAVAATLSLVAGHLTDVLGARRALYAAQRLGLRTSVAGGVLAAGHPAGLVSLGFFAGFVVGPSVVGPAADRAGYGWSWLTVGVVFAVSALAARSVRTSSRSG